MEPSQDFLTRDQTLPGGF